MSAKTAIVIGSGISGLSAACYLAKRGMKVTVLEKNEHIGGRARKFYAHDFMFDMGPSWYWMPDVFEKFYNDFGHTTSDFYELKRLDPGYQIFRSKGDPVQIPASMNELEALFERFEPGSALKLRTFLKEAEYKYQVGMNDLVYKPGLSLFEYADLQLINGLVRMDVFTSISRHIRSFVTHPFLIELLEFPVLFLGALPGKTPALYSLMNYADMSLGTWYPMGGMHKIIEAFSSIAVKNGVEIKCKHEVKHISSSSGRVKQVVTDYETFTADVVVGAGDYHHIEQQLLVESDRTYSPSYWKSRKMAPSCLLYYVGVKGRIPGLQHHNLFFDTDFMQHAHDIYTNPQWPAQPLFYASAPSVTDASVAPQGCENLFLLVPVAPGLKDDEAIRNKYYGIVMDRLEQHTGINVRGNVVYNRSYAFNDFVSDYHAYKGNAYGLANTLRQTALLKPKIRSKKLSNLYYAGQLTVPGPGLPPGVISGNVVAGLIAKDLSLHKIQ